MFACQRREPADLLEFGIQGLEAEQSAHTYETLHTVAFTYALLPQQPGKDPFPSPPPKRD